MRVSLVSVAMALFLGACGAAPPAEVPSEPARGGDPLNACDATKYPCAPYGYLWGDVLPNLEFVGRADDNKDGVISPDDPVRKIRLSDYYQDKNIHVLAILVSAEWCPPCQAEQGELIDSWKQYQADKKGVAYVGVLIESTNRSPADVGTVDRWTARNWTNNGKKPATMAGKIPFPFVADPTNQLGPYYPQPAFPMQMVVTTSDMVIQWTNNGYGPGGLEQQIDTYLP